VRLAGKGSMRRTGRNNMGCDIESWVEVYNPATDKWTAVRYAFPTSAWERSLNMPDFVSVPFRTRDYGLFGFLANVRNYSNCEPLDKPRGLPVGFDLEGGCAVMNELEVVSDVHIPTNDLANFHSHSWFLLSELLAFDYERILWNRRIRRGIDGAALAEAGEGVYQTYRDFLGQEFFDTLEIMRRLGEPNRVRVVFCFGD
jgi:hypothetical protein